MRHYYYGGDTVRYVALTYGVYADVVFAPHVGNLGKNARLVFHRKRNIVFAEKVGFSDPHYFGISFKKMTGYTPTEYAREKRR